MHNKKLQDVTFKQKQVNISVFEKNFQNTIALL